MVHPEKKNLDSFENDNSFLSSPAFSPQIYKASGAKYHIKDKRKCSSPSDSLSSLMVQLLQ